MERGIRKHWIFPFGFPRYPDSVAKGQALIQWLGNKISFTTETTATLARLESLGGLPVPVKHTIAQ